jgi:gliding motility-associated lipoprotein GldJ
MRFLKKSRYLLLSSVVLLVISSCGGKGDSAATGWKYNDEEWGGFQNPDFKEQATGPNLVLVEGGTFMMGATEEDVFAEHNNIQRRITVSSFYMDETEVANIHYKEFIWWMDKTFGEDYPQVVKAVRPDTLVWRDELAYNEPFVEYYFTYPAYNDYPVVGVSWLQANQYAEWRSDRVNEMMLIKNGYLENNNEQVNEDNFNTDAYLHGQYIGATKNTKQSKGQSSEETGSGEEDPNLSMSDGILLPDYRLPTEAEWEYAALALAGETLTEGEEVVANRKIYPWVGTSLRYQQRNGFQGDFLANFKRGRGDNMGVAGALNDNAEITAKVYANMPNDFGLYNMAGNVSEWVQDVFRPITFSDANDFNTFRGNEFKQKVVDADGNVVDKDSLGRIQYELQKDEDLINRRNYNTADARNYADGDSTSNVAYGYGSSSLISDKARVYKGGSWNDRAYWLSPGARRYLNEDLASSQIGFRCAMSRMGSVGGQHFKEGKKAKKQNAAARKY